jgi:hypothetical protein
MDAQDLQALGEAVGAVVLVGLAAPVMAIGAVGNMFAAACCARRGGQPGRPQPGQVRGLAGIARRRGSFDDFGNVRQDPIADAINQRVRAEVNQGQGFGLAGILPPAPVAPARVAPAPVAPARVAPEPAEGYDFNQIGINIQFRPDMRPTRVLNNSVEMLGLIQSVDDSQIQTHDVGNGMFRIRENAGTIRIEGREIRVLRAIGQGAYGQVCRVRDRISGREFALKRQSIGENASADAIIKEAMIHYIVYMSSNAKSAGAIYRVFKSNDNLRIYFLIELLHSDLQTFITQRPQTAVSCFIRCARMLQPLWNEFQYNHCDFKPDNVLIRKFSDERGQHRWYDPRLADFGFNRLVYGPGIEVKTNTVPTVFNSFRDLTQLSFGLYHFIPAVPRADDRGVIAYTLDGFVGCTLRRFGSACNNLRGGRYRAIWRDLYDMVEDPGANNRRSTPDAVLLYNQEIEGNILRGMAEAGVIQPNADLAWTQPVAPAVAPAGRIAVPTENREARRVFDTWGDAEAARRARRGGVKNKVFRLAKNNVRRTFRPSGRKSRRTKTRHR